MVLTSESLSPLKKKLIDISIKNGGKETNAGINLF